MSIYLFLILKLYNLLVNSICENKISIHPLPLDFKFLPIFSTLTIYVYKLLIKMIKVQSYVYEYMSYKTSSIIIIDFILSISNIVPKIETHEEKKKFKHI